MPRLNFTGRKRIRREDAQVNLSAIGNGSYKPELALNLTPYDFPSSAKIRLELINREMLWRRGFGSIATPGFKGPSVISGLSADAPLYARLKVVDSSSGTAKILGLMRKVRVFGRIAPGQGAATQSFVEVMTEDLGQQVWRLELPDDDNEAPVLLVNKHIEQARTMATDPLFRSVVMPVVLEKVLEGILVESNFRKFDEDSVWSRILQFAERLSPADAVRQLPDGTIDQSDVRVAKDWIQDTVRAWAVQHEFASHFDSNWNRGQK